ncbi:hypothetical protein J2R80_000637 [Bradyrhizobium sp. USDA 4541]|nr:hypothetical protein [Bradyrhizobium sp. USDA 4541]
MHSARAWHFAALRSSVMPSTSKVALFIDGANLYATA